jgi:glycosyltransferase involved in cell wall biosynthesis
MNPKHIAVFEPRTEGHHPGWLRFMVEDLLSAGFQLTLAVDERPGRFDVIRDNLGDLLRKVRVLNLFDANGHIRGGSELSCMEWALAESGADQLFMGALDEVASAVFRRAAFGLLPPKRLRQRCGGIFHRPRFLDPGSARWSLNQKLKFRGYRRLLDQSFFAPILFVDPFIWEHERKRFPRASLHYLPDPCPDGFVGEKQSARSKLGFSAEQFIFLFFGVPSRRKGLHVAVKAMQQLDSPGTMLFCAGRQGSDREVKKGLEDLTNLGKAKVLDRYVSAEEEKLCFQAADAVLLPYLGHFGTSGVLSRAIAAEKLVIASDEQLLGRLVREWGIGLLSPPGDARQLTDAMYRAIKLDQHERLQIAEAVKRYAKAHSRDVYRDTLVRALSSPAAN